MQGWTWRLQTISQTSLKKLDDYLLWLNTVSTLAVKHAPWQPPAVRSSLFNRRPAALPLLPYGGRKWQGGTESWGTSLVKFKGSVDFSWIPSLPERRAQCEPLWKMRRDMGWSIGDNHAAMCLLRCREHHIFNNSLNNYYMSFSNYVINEYPFI